MAEGLGRLTYLAAKPDEAWLRETVIEALLRFDGSAWLADLKDHADYRLHGLDILEATLEDAGKVVGMVSEEAIRHVVRALREEGVVTIVVLVLRLR